MYSRILIHSRHFSPLSSSYYRPKCTSFPGRTIPFDSCPQRIDYESPTLRSLHTRSSTRLSGALSNREHSDFLDVIPLFYRPRLAVSYSSAFVYPSFAHCFRYDLPSPSVPIFILVPLAFVPLSVHPCRPPLPLLRWYFPLYESYFPHPEAAVALQSSLLLLCISL